MSPFHALVAEILLSRTRAQQVVPVFREVCTRFPTPGAMASATSGQISRVIRALGLAWRARVLRDLAVELNRSCEGVVPRDEAELRGLPGVGRYVASSFLSFHCGVRAAIVDSNIVRIYSRLYGLRAGPESHRSREFRAIANALTPRARFKEFNYAVLDFTRSVCKPRAPRCSACMLATRCAYAVGEAHAAGSA